jgi:hypothetical protein
MIITEIRVLNKKKLYAIDPPHKAGDRAFHSVAEVRDGISERIEDVVIPSVEVDDESHLKSPPQRILQP